MGELIAFCCGVLIGLIRIGHRHKWSKWENYFAEEGILIQSRQFEKCGRTDLEYS